MSKNATEKSVIDFHRGNTLERLATSYPKVPHVILECVQNALDSNSTSIRINVNYNKREIRILDNGDGTDKERFDQALKLVCQSRKTGTEGKLGQFGIGLISALGKCEYYTFTSTPKNDPFGYRQWTFNSKDLLSQADELIIPNRRMDKLAYLVKQAGREQLVWRTEIFLHNITADKTISKVSGKDLRDEIISHFGEKMRMLGARITLIITDKKDSFEEDFTAPDFSGKKLDAVKYEEKGIVKARFELYQAVKDSKGVRKGKIGFGTKADPFRLDCSIFLNHRLISPEASDLLLSGFFEGNIISADCTLKKERNGFVENDELLNFCQLIERWYKEVGKEFYNKEVNSQKDEKYQATGLKCLKTIENLLKKDQFSSLREIIEDIGKGSIGPNHTGYHSQKGKEEETRSLTTKAMPAAGNGKKMKTIGFEELKKLKTEEQSSGANGVPPTPDAPAPSASTARGHYENVQHHTVNGTKRGSLRKTVKGKSTGLRLEYDEMPGEYNLWDFNKKTGVLRFNIRHTLWAQAERRERVLTKFQEIIIVSALTLETEAESDRAVQRTFAEKQIRYHLHLIEAEGNYAAK